MAEAGPALLHAQPRSAHALIDRVWLILDRRLRSHGAVRAQVMRMRASCLLTQVSIRWEARACDGPARNRGLLGLVIAFLLLVIASPFPVVCCGPLSAITPVVAVKSAIQCLQAQ